MKENKTEINKPITIVIDELEHDLIETINNANIPFCLVEPVLERILTGVKSVAAQQLQMDKESYKKALEANKKATEIEK